MKCQHEHVFVNIRVMGWESYTWSAQEGLAWDHADGKSEMVPKSGKCADCGVRVFRDFDRKPGGQP